MHRKTLLKTPGGTSVPSLNDVGSRIKHFFLFIG